MKMKVVAAPIPSGSGTSLQRDPWNNPRGQPIALAAIYSTPSENRMHPSTTAQRYGCTGPKTKDDDGRGDFGPLIHRQQTKILGPSFKRAWVGFLLRACVGRTNRPTMTGPVSFFSRSRSERSGSSAAAWSKQPRTRRGKLQVSRVLTSDCCCRCNNRWPRNRACVQAAAAHLGAGARNRVNKKLVGSVQTKPFLTLHAQSKPIATSSKLFFTQYYS